MALYVGIPKSTVASSTIKLSQLAGALGAQLRGDGMRTIHGMATLDQAGERELSFGDGPGAREALGNTRAGAVLLAEKLAPLCSVDCLVVDDARLAYAKASQYFALPAPPPSIHASAVIDPSAQLAPDVHIGPLCHIAAGASIGERSVLESGAVIGCDARIGADCRIGPHAVISHGCQLGERTSIGSGSVIGGDGFGFAWAGKERRWEKIAQLRRVVVGADVTIGALSTIDRGALVDTRIGDGVKIDSHVHFGHGVEVGGHCAFAGLSAVGGSTHFGRWCRVGGGCAISGHLNIGDGVTITGRSSVMRDVPAGATIGSMVPASNMSGWLRTVALLPRLSALFRRVTALEQRPRAG